MHERALTAGDLSEALRFSAAAGWNQIAADWQLMLAAGDGVALTEDDALVATGIALPYGSVGWISMILVREDRRGGGLATRIVERTAARLRDHGIVPVVDATPAGREIYSRAGAADGWSSQRLRGDVSRRVLAAAPPPGVTLRALAPDDLDAVLALDRDAFGAQRPAIVRALAARLPAAAAVAECDGRCIGFVLGRDGRTAAQIGPIVADEPAVAAALLSHALAAIDRAVYIDIPDAHTALRASLIDAGFTVERPFTRMAFGDPRAVTPPDRTYAIAGPELG